MILKLKFISILTIILLFSSCAKEEVDCRIDLYGTYTGLQTCIDPSGSNSSTTTLALSKSVQDDKIVITISGIGFIGTVSADCSTITMAPQLYSGTATISGNFIMNGTSLTGSFVASDSWGNSNCSLNLTQL
jgi:hypothetical protein